MIEKKFILMLTESEIKTLIEATDHAVDKCQYYYERCHPKFEAEAKRDMKKFMDLGEWLENFMKEKV